MFVCLSLSFRFKFAVYASLNNITVHGAAERTFPLHMRERQKDEQRRKKKNWKRQTTPRNHFQHSPRTQHQTTDHRNTAQYLQGNATEPSTEQRTLTQYTAHTQNAAHSGFRFGGFHSERIPVFLFHDLLYTHLRPGEEEVKGVKKKGGGGGIGRARDVREGWKEKR